MSYKPSPCLSKQGEFNGFLQHTKKQIMPYIPLEEQL